MLRGCRIAKAVRMRSSVAVAIAIMALLMSVVSARPAPAASASSATPVAGALMHDIYLPDPGPVAVDPVTNRIYVAADDSLSVVDGATNTLVATVPFTGPVARDEDKLVVDSATNTIYVDDREGLVVVDGSTDTVSHVL